MDNYKKPIAILYENLAEGIFMASGADSNCYIASAQIHQVPEPGRDDYRIQINGVHKADHTKEKQQLIITFNQNVTYSNSQGTLKSGDGTNKLIIEYHYHQNPNDNIGLGDLIVKSNPNLAIVEVKITD